MFSELIKKRILAYLIDCVIISIPLYAVAIIYWEYLLKSHPDQILNLALFLQFVPALLYFFVSELFFDKTIGKKILKLKIEQTKTNNKYLSIFVRTISRLIPLDLATFIIFENELLHDRLSKTKVVENI